MSISQVGLPKELSPEMEYQLPAGLSSYPVRVVPSNVSSITSGTLPTLVASTLTSLSFPSTPIILDVPAGQGKSVFLDHRYSTLSFRVNYEVVSAGSSCAITNAYLRSNAQSWIERMTTYSSNGLVLDDINNFGLVADTQLQLEMDIAQRDVLSSMYGLLYEQGTASSANLNQGHAISGWHNSTISVNNNYVSYCVPLMNSLIGVDAKRFFNIGAVPKLQIQLTTPSVAPITLLTGAITTGGTLRITIDQIQLNLQYIDVGADGVKMMSNGGLQYYAGSTYRVSSQTIPSGAGGQLSLLTGVKGSSVRSIITRVNDTAFSTTGSVNERYDAKCLLSVATNYNVNGVRVPSFPIDQVRNPALSFATLQECNSSFTPREMKSSITPDRFAVYVASSNVPTDKDVILSTTASTYNNLASSFFGYSLEKISKAGILDGASLNGSNTYVEFNTGSSTTTNACMAYFIAKMDIIYVLSPDGELSVRM